MDHKSHFCSKSCSVQSMSITGISLLLCEAQPLVAIKTFYFFHVQYQDYRYDVGSVWIPEICFYMKTPHLIYIKWLKSISGSSKEKKKKNSSRRSNSSRLYYIHKLRCSSPRCAMNKCHYVQKRNDVIVDYFYLTACPLVFQLSPSCAFLFPFIGPFNHSITTRSILNQNEEESVLISVSDHYQHFIM